MLSRVLEPEVMDTAQDALDYDAMDHSAVNRAFAADFLSAWPAAEGVVLDVGTGTALIPIELCFVAPKLTVLAVDAAGHMLALADKNTAAAGLADRIRTEKVSAQALPYPGRHFAAVVSNSIVHHIPDPFPVLAEMARVCKTGGVLFVRDLLRPANAATVRRLVDTYAAGANARQRQLFDDSLRAALSLDEVRDLVKRAGFDPAGVMQTTDRHWTWAAVVS